MWRPVGWSPLERSLGRSLRCAHLKLTILVTLVMKTIMMIMRRIMTIMRTIMMIMRMILNMMNYLQGPATRKEGGQVCRTWQEKISASSHSDLTLCIFIFQKNFFWSSEMLDNQPPSIREVDAAQVGDQCGSATTWWWFVANNTLLWFKCVIIAIHHHHDHHRHHHTWGHDNEGDLVVCVTSGKTGVDKVGGIGQANLQVL